MKSGTYELYRDLLSPGGINNLIPGAGVLALIGAPALIQGLDRLQRNPVSSLDVLQGLINAGLSDILHPNLDSWWQQRGFRGDVNHLPILMIDGFFDVESRGAFQAYQALKGDGAHLTVIGAHDGAPAGTDGAAGESAAWFEHYLRGAANGVQSSPRVKLWMSDGDRENDLAGDFVRYDGADWPLPGTRWASLALDATRSGSSHSPNDGSLGLTMAPTATVQSYLALPSLFTNTDPPNTAILGGFGLNALTTAAPILSDMTLSEPLGLSYTTKPLTSDVLSAGPASLELRLSSTAPQTNVWAVISDVSPDGTPHPVASGRLNSAYPDIDVSRSLKDPVTGDIVEPFGDYSRQTPAALGQQRLYHLEFWPIGNRFKKGDRMRLTIVGASMASLPSLPAINSVVVGGAGGSRLLLPVLPGSNLATALPPSPPPAAPAGLLSLSVTVQRLVSATLRLGGM
jgi:putative CocE/NonD family hydrolase